MASPPESSVSSPTPALEIASLSKLSADLALLVLDPDLACSDADIVLDGGAPVGVHRCILAARSTFFRGLFARPAAEGKPRYQMSELLPYGRVGREAFVAFLEYLYTGKLKPPPPEAVTCVDDDCFHDACRPVVDFAVEMMCASSVFQVPELVALLECHLLKLVDKALVEDVIPILMVAFHSDHRQLLSYCIQRVTRSGIDSMSLEKELPYEVTNYIESLRNATEPPADNVQNVDPDHQRRINSIHRALDSDDVELISQLLPESYVTLDDANALHYAAAYCDPNVVKKVLELGLAHVNRKNERGYTPLHVAAMRREPAVIMSLLTKGASASVPTADGRSAVGICRRLTRAKDYNAKMEKGEETNRDRICIDILEREMTRDPLSEEESDTMPLFADDLNTKLLYLEYRVAFARSFFPTEAKLAMKISEAESTSVYFGCSSAKSSSKLRVAELNESSSIPNEKLRSRLDALMKTVELGRRFFPHCTKVMDKYLSDAPNLPYFKNGTPDERKMKRLRFSEFKQEIQKALLKDKAENKTAKKCML